MTDETPTPDVARDATDENDQPGTPDWAHSFGSVAEAYERGRPTYPADAVQWMLGDQPRSACSSSSAPATGKLDAGAGRAGPRRPRHRSRCRDAGDPRGSGCRAFAPPSPVPRRSPRRRLGGRRGSPRRPLHWFDLDRALPGDLAGAGTRRADLPGLEPAQREDLGWVRRASGTLIGTQEQAARPCPGTHLQRAPVRLRRGARVQPLADRRSQDHPGPRALPLQRRRARRREGAVRLRPGRGARVLRRLRPRDADGMQAPLRHPLLRRDLPSTGRPERSQRRRRARCDIGREREAPRRTRRRAC